MAEVLFSGTDLPSHQLWEFPILLSRFLVLICLRAEAWEEWTHLMF